MASWGAPAVDDVVLVCSELVELAVEGTGASTRLGLELRSGVVRVEAVQRWPDSEGWRATDHERLVCDALDALGATWGVAAASDDVLCRWVEVPC